MASKHNPRFVKLVEAAKVRIQELSVDEVKAKQDRGDSFRLIDVREESEWEKSRLPGAIHIGKGILERDAETRLPDLQEEIVLYCGGGYRSALAADALHQMGYERVVSMDGGYRGWTERGYPVIPDFAGDEEE